MSNQINKFELVELSTEEQQLISGGYGHCSPCYKPRKSCGYKPPRNTCGYKPYYEHKPYRDYGYPEYC